MSDVRYPIGKFQRPEKLTRAERRALIDQIAAACGFKETPPQFTRQLIDYAISNLSVSKSKTQRATLAKV